MYTGVLFADLRGFTAPLGSKRSRDRGRAAPTILGCAERVLFPEAIIDKVVGDQVMALYLPDVQRRISRDGVASVDARTRP